MLLSRNSYLSIVYNWVSKVTVNWYYKNGDTCHHVIYVLFYNETHNDLMTHFPHHRSIMMTSSNGNHFRVTGPLCGEFTGEFLSQRPVTWSFDVFFDRGLNKPLSKQSRRWWLEKPSCSSWRHCNDCDMAPHTSTAQDCSSISSVLARPIREGVT